MAKNRYVVYACVLLLLAAGASVFASGLAQGSNFVRIFVGGEEIVEPGDAYVVDGKTFAPVRAIVEALGFSVAWEGESRTVRISAEPSHENQAMRIDLLEQALRPISPGDAIGKWAEGVKTRNGALQYAVMSPGLREQNYEYFVSSNWVTATSSPWVESYEITEESEALDGAVLYKVKFALATSTGDAGTIVSDVVVKQYDETWLVDQITEEFEFPGFEPSYTDGIVKQIDQSGERPRFLLEGGPISNGEPFLIWLSVSEDTEFCFAEVSEDGEIDPESFTQASFDDLEIGQQVKVLIPGPILESYPARGGASEVLILK